MTAAFTLIQRKCLKCTKLFKCLESSVQEYCSRECTPKQKRTRGGSANWEWRKSTTKKKEEDRPEEVPQLIGDDDDDL